MVDEFKPSNVEKDPMYNREPGILQVPGSNLAKEMSKFEQFPTGWGTAGNPYVYREFPKMLYRAQLWSGKAFCMAPDPDRMEFSNKDEYSRTVEKARRFTAECQRVVKNESEMTKAQQSGWRESPADAVTYLEGREKEVSNETAERLYADRNMSEGAKAESEAATQEAGGEHLAEIPETPLPRFSRTAKAAPKKRARKKTAKKATRRRKV